MTMTMLRTIVAACWSVASMPATLAHEATHWLVSLPWASQSAVIHDDCGFVHGVEWGEQAPTWAIVFTSLAPTLLGSLVGLIGLLRLLTAPPGSTRVWFVTGAIAGWWVIYVMPSSDDLDFYSQRQRQQEQQTTGGNDNG